MRRRPSRSRVPGRPESLETRSLLSAMIALVDTGVDLTAGDRSFLTNQPYYDLADSYNAYTQQTATAQGQNVADNSFGGNPGHGHGSTVADALVAGIQAVAAQPGAGQANPSVLVVRDTDNSGNIDLEALIRGVYYAADKGAAAINISVGYTYNAGTDVPGLVDPSKPGATFFTLSDAVNYARSKGAVVVTPAGNNGIQNQPQGVNIDDPNNNAALFPTYLHTSNMIVVGSADPTNGNALFPGSNYGPMHVDLAAPLDPNNWQTSQWQTSYASGYAAGVTGALAGLDPALKGDALAAFIKANVQPVAALVGKVATGGVLSPSNLVHAVSPTLPAVTATASVDPSQTSAALHVVGISPANRAGIVFTWSVADKPAGAPDPTFNLNGTSAAQDTVATFSQAGTYTLLVTLKNAANQTETSAVIVTIHAVPTEIVPGKTSATLNQGASTTFPVKIADQFGNTLTSPPPVTYSIAPGGAGGTITPSGKYQAPAFGAGAGTDKILITSGSLTRWATVNVIRPGALWHRWRVWNVIWLPTANTQWATWTSWGVTVKN